MLPGEEGKSWCLYQIQTSIVVVGTHNRRWTAYAIKDDYYQEKCKDSVKQHHRSWKKTPDIFEDPILGVQYQLINNTTGTGRDEAPSASIFWEQKQYCIAAVETLVEAVTKEWRYIVSKIEETVCHRHVSLLSGFF